MIYKRGKGKKKWYWMDNTVNEVRYQEPLKTRNWQEALQKERDRLLEIAQHTVQQESQRSIAQPMPILKKENFIQQKRHAGQIKNVANHSGRHVASFLSRSLHGR